jgi:hypothetical protein
MFTFMDESKSTSFYIKFILALVGVGLLVWGVSTFFPIGGSGDQLENSSSFSRGSFATTEPSACGSISTSSVSVSKRDMVATSPSVPGYIGMDVSGMSADLKLSQYKDRAFPVVVCVGDMSGQLSFGSSGVVSFSDDLSTTTISDSYKASGFVTVNATGTGQLTVDVDVGEDGSAYSYSKRLKVFVLAKENRLYVGQSSFMALDIKHLKWLRDTGEITQSEYKQKLKDLGTMRVESDE